MREAPQLSGTDTRHEYDVVSQLTRTLRPGGDTVSFAYDVLGRTTKSVFSLAATADIV